MLRTVSLLALVAAFASSPSTASAVIVPLAATPTATVEQGGFPVTNALTNDGTGWATSSSPSVAIFPTVNPIAAANNTFTFTLESDVFGNHVLGKFRISVTTDVTPTLGGSWLLMNPVTASALFSNPVTIHPSQIVQAADVNANVDTITYVATKYLVPNITGFRLEAIQDGTGAYIGPGIPGNDNFVLDLFQVDAVPFAGFIDGVPEPSTNVLLGLGGAALAWQARRLRRS